MSICKLSESGDEQKALNKEFESFVRKTNARNTWAVAHTFNPSTQEAQAGGSLNLRPVWSTQQVPGQPGLHRETLFCKANVGVCVRAGEMAQGLRARITLAEALGSFLAPMW